MQGVICPSNHQLESFLLGLSIGEDAQLVEQHVSCCSLCLAKLSSLDKEDRLITLTRKQATSGGRPQVDNQVQTIIDQLKELCSCNRNVSETRAFLQDASTLHEIFDPSNGEDELGRLGDYKILRLVGSGGMGLVFQAHDTVLNRSVAIKILRPSSAADTNVRERFLAEARAVASIEHDHIVPIFHIGEKKGILFFVMPYLHGESLAERMKREGPLPEKLIRRIGAEVAKGLGAAHRHGLIHRDIKPANIWLEAGSDRVKLLDFGLVRIIEEDVRRTQLGVFVGTPLYMSPEQADGRTLDARCDLFSLGSVLYVLSTGDVPFPGNTILAVLQSVCNDKPRPITKLNPKISRSLIQTIDKLHAKDPQDRFASADEVCNILLQAADGKRRLFKGNWLAAIAAGLLLLCLATIIVWAAKLFDRDRARQATSKNLSQPGMQVNGNHIVQKQKDASDLISKKKKLLIYPAALFAFAERGNNVAGLGKTVRDLLFAKLTTHPDLILVEREDIQRAIQELELNLSGAVKPADAAQVGQLTGAKLQISGSVLQVDGRLHVIAQIVGTETTRMAGTSVNGKEPLDQLVSKLADKIKTLIQEKAVSLVAEPVPVKDRIVALKGELGNGPRPIVMIQVEERLFGGTDIDPAAATELQKICKETGFTILDPEKSVAGNAEVWIKGEAFCEMAARRGDLLSMKARVELRAIEQNSGRILASDRQTAIVIDLTEQIAGTAALQEATAVLAQRLLPKIVGENK